MKAYQTCGIIGNECKFYDFVPKISGDIMPSNIIQNR